jgi:hypothetical protein
LQRAARKQFQKCKVTLCNKLVTNHLPGGSRIGGRLKTWVQEPDPNSAVLVCAIPYGDANANVVNGRLPVYDAVHPAADGSLKVLWESQRLAITFLFNTFDPPVIDGGQIYVPKYHGGVDLYRLAVGAPRESKSGRLTPFAIANSKTASGEAFDQCNNIRRTTSLVAIIVYVSVGSALFQAGA